MSRFYWTPQEERASLDQAEQHRQARKKVRDRPDLGPAAQNWNALRKAYPWLGAGQLYSLTLMHKTPDDPATRQIALNFATPKVLRDRGLPADAVPKDVFLEAGGTKKQWLAARGKRVQDFTEQAMTVPSPEAAAGLGAFNPEVKRVPRGFGGFDVPGVVGTVTGGLWGAAEQQSRGITGGVTAPDVSPISDAASTIQQGIKAGVRTGLVGLQTGYEAANAYLRTMPPTTGEAARMALGGGPVGGTPRPAFSPGYVKDPLEYAQKIAGQTTGGAAIGQLARGEEVQLGTGLTPDPNLSTGQAQSRATREAWSVGGKGATMGRIVASTVSDPGSEAYHILSGIVDAVAITKGDPTNIALGAFSKAKAARKTITPAPLTPDLEAAGGRSGLRLGVHGPTADEWLTKPKVAAFNSAIAAEPDEARIWRALPDNFPLVSRHGENIVGSLAQAKTTPEVNDVWRRVLGVDVSQPPSVGGIKELAQGVTSHIPSPRIFGMVPGRTIDLRDLNSAIPTMEAYMRNGKVPQEMRDAILTNVFRTAQGGLLARPDRYDVIHRMGTAIHYQLENYGIPKEVARDLTQVWADSHEANRAYFTKAAADGTFIDGLVLDGKPIDFSTHPFLLTQALNNTVDLPDFREIRKATSQFGPLLRNPATRTTEAMLDAYMNKWRLGVLLKPNLALRVLGEEQARMAASGLHSLFSHPARAISAMLGGTIDHPWMRSLLEKVPGVGERMASEMTTNIGSYKTGVTGSTFEFAMSDPRSHYAQALYANWGDLRPNMQKVMLDDWVRVPRTDERWGEGLAAELGQMHPDPVVQAVVGVPVGGKDISGDAAAIKEAFWSGPLKSAREALSHEEHFAPLARSRQFADSYVDGTFAYVAEKTGNDPRLLETLRTGKFEGVPLFDRYGSTRADTVSELQKLGGESLSTFGPDEVKLQRSLDVTRAKGVRGTIKGANEGLDHLLDALFFNLMPRGSNFMDRSSAYRQYYWKDIAQRLPYVPSELHAQVLENARQANLPATEVRDLGLIKSVVDDVPHGKFGTMKDPRALTLDQLDLGAHATALDDTKNLLYDLSEKRQYSDVTRLIFPFLEAWKEVIGRWAKIVVANPSVVRTAAKDLAGLRAAGVFYQDPQTGQEVYGIPGTGWLSEQMFGIPVPLAGDLKGTNIIGNGMPGMGPIAQLPASILLPDDPNLDWLHQAFFPYGSIPSTGNPVMDLINAGLPIPAWMRRGLNAFNDPDRYRPMAVTTGNVMRYLASSEPGKYDPSTPHGFDRLVRDAKAKAQEVEFFRAAALGLSPSAPSPQYQVKDKEGNTVLAFAVAQDFRKMLKAHKGNFDDALTEYLDKYGTQNILTIQAFSEPVKGYLPPTKKALEWARRHPDARDQNADVYGYFAPGQHDKFDINVFSRSFDRGERSTPTPEEMLKAANNRLASHLYREMAKKMPAHPTEEQTNALRDYKTALTKDYKGYNESGYDYQKVPSLILKLRTALENPTMARTDAGRAAKDFFAVYDTALVEARNRHVTTLDNNAMRDVADALRQYGEALVKDHPDFENMWNYVLSHALGKEQQSSAVGGISMKGGAKINPADYSSGRLNGVLDRYAQKVARAKAEGKKVTADTRLRSTDPVAVVRRWFAGGGNATLHPDSTADGIGDVRRAADGTWEYRTAQSEQNAAVQTKTRGGPVNTNEGAIWIGPSDVWKPLPFLHDTVASAASLGSKKKKAKPKGIAGGTQ